MDGRRGWRESPSMRSRSGQGTFVYVAPSVVVRADAHVRTNVACAGAVGRTGVTVRAGVIARAVHWVARRSLSFLTGLAAVALAIAAGPLPAAEPPQHASAAQAASVASTVHVAQQEPAAPSAATSAGPGASADRSPTPPVSDGADRAGDDASSGTADQVAGAHTGYAEAGRPVTLPVPVRTFRPFPARPVLLGLAGAAPSGPRAPPAA